MVRRRVDPPNENENPGDEGRQDRPAEGEYEVPNEHDYEDVNDLVREVTAERAKKAKGVMKKVQKKPRATSRPAPQEKMEVEAPTAPTPQAEQPRGRPPPASADAPANEQEFKRRRQQPEEAQQLEEPTSSMPPPPAWEDPPEADDEEVSIPLRVETGIIHEPDPCPDIDEETKKAVRKAHRNLGHPSRESFVRMLRLGGTKPDAMRYARLWTCATCAQMKAPSMQRPAMVKKEVQDFNDTVSLDLLTVHDVNMNRYEVISIVDWGSRYHVAAMMKDKTSGRAARKFCTHWINWVGAPRKVQMDQGGELQG